MLKLKTHLFETLDHFKKAILCIFNTIFAVALLIMFGVTYSMVIVVLVINDCYDYVKRKVIY